MISYTDEHFALFEVSWVYSHLVLVIWSLLNIMHNSAQN